MTLKSVCDVLKVRIAVSFGQTVRFRLSELGKPTVPLWRLELLYEPIVRGRSQLDVLAVL